LAVEVPFVCIPKLLSRQKKLAAAKPEYMFVQSNKVLLVLIFHFFHQSCFGQVISGPYDMLLSGMLRHSVPEVSVQQVVSHLKGTILLDAREPIEFSVSHINGALSVGYEHFDLNKWLYLPKNSPIVVYCSVGYRSEKISEHLLAAGFINVSNLYGGIFEWVNEGLLVVDASGATNRVHAYNAAWGIWLNKGEKVYE
jgi:rhodanese-related sulfurtransferase